MPVDSAEGWFEEIGSVETEASLRRYDGVSQRLLESRTVATILEVCFETPLISEIGGGVSPVHEPRRLWRFSSVGRGRSGEASGCVEMKRIQKRK